MLNYVTIALTYLIVGKQLYGCLEIYSSMMEFLLSKLKGLLSLPTKL